MTDTAETTTTATVAIAAESLGHDLLDTMIAQMAKLPGWDKAPVQQHDDAIRELRASVERLVRDTINILVGRTFPSCAATLSTVSFGDGIKATLKIASSADFRHELADAAGSQVVVIISDPDAYLQRMDELKAKAPQGDLFGTLTAAAAIEDKHCILHNMTFPGNGYCQECGPVLENGLDDQLPEAPADQVAKDAIKKAGGYGKGPRGTAKGAKNAADPRRLTIRGTLDQLYIFVTDGVVQGWTDEELAAAVNYAVRKLDYPQSSLPLPAFLPAPQPPAGPYPPGEDPDQDQE